MPESAFWGQKTILFDFLDIEITNERIKEMTELGLVLSPLEVSSGMNMVDSIESIFDAEES